MKEQLQEVQGYITDDQGYRGFLYVEELNK